MDLHNSFVIPTFRRDDSLKQITLRLFGRRVIFVLRKDLYLKKIDEISL